METLHEIATALNLELLRHEVITNYASSSKCEFMELMVRCALREVCNYDWKQDADACKYYINGSDQENCQYTLDVIIHKIVVAGGTLNNLK